MKLKFKKQDFQIDAVNSVADIFSGQENSVMTFSVESNYGSINMPMSEFGFGNKLEIDKDTMLANMHNVQRAHKLPLTYDYEDKQFSVEMETGTGKTFVYTKTILELNKRYGFTKFIIVVPSVAIREGVYKSLQVTEERFAIDYDNVPYHYFIYNSSRLNDVRQFARTDGIEIMIINIDAFKKAENIINQEQDKLNGEAAIKYIQATNPIVIIDEPQSVDNTAKSKEAISSLNPLAVFRYSATHRDKINLLYKLTPVDAFQKGLVKQICVSSNKVSNDFNKPYIYLKSVSNKNGFTAKIELDVMGESGKVERVTKTVESSSDLYKLSGKRSIYDGYVIEGINCTEGAECIEFSNSEILKLGETFGTDDENIVKRAQIYRTIEVHLEKELQYFKKGIKVLSLFFIDEVKKYRTETGEKGIYAHIFEECYNELINKPKFAELKTYFDTTVEKAHGGYFSQDKKGTYKNTKGDTQADDDTYNTIMKDKEYLLSFECPLRFIFSHSALKEGWDNPNVFQVCTLIDQKSVFTCRQKIGRGLRLCVNQDGERVEDKNINILHVMANESFSEFADKLQKEIEDETGYIFGAVQYTLFEDEIEVENDIEHEIEENQAFDVFEALTINEVLDSEGKIKEDVSIEDIKLPETIEEPLKQEIHKIIESKEPVTFEKIKEIKYTETKKEKVQISKEDFEIAQKIMVEDKITTKEGKIIKSNRAKLAEESSFKKLKERLGVAKARAVIQQVNKIQTMPPLRDDSKEVKVRRKEAAILSPEFRALWNKIKQKTTYRVNIDSDKLIKNCITSISEMPDIPMAKIVTEYADLGMDSSGIYDRPTYNRTKNITVTYHTLPDIVRLITNETHLTRATVIKILNESERLQDFINNPQAFYENVLEIIKKERHKLAIDGIKYVKLDGQEYYFQEIFDSEEIPANVDKNAIEVEHSIYDYVIYDSPTIEKPFAKALDEDPDVKMFFKIPSRFKIDTPIGTYNPDWAVVLEKDSEQKIYFVIESKGSTDEDDLRTPERLKFNCGKRHFKALDDVSMPEKPVRNWKEFKATL